MKDDQIVILGKNADAYANNQTSDSFDWKLIRDARFAQLVAAAEREAMLEAVGAGGVSEQRVTQDADHIAQPRKMVATQEPFGYFKAEPFGWRDCAETDEGAIALYEAPQPQADALDACEGIPTEALKDEAPRSCVTGKSFLQEEDQRALHRLIETSEDNEGFDIGKEAIKRLANLGVVGRLGFGRYGVTVFGYWVHEHYRYQNPSLPLKTKSDRDADARAAIAAAKEDK